MRSLWLKNSKFYFVSISLWSANVPLWMLNFVCPCMMPSTLAIYIHLKWIHSCKMFHVAWTTFGIEIAFLYTTLLFTGGGLRFHSFSSFLFLNVPGLLKLDFFLPFSVWLFGNRRAREQWMGHRGVHLYHPKAESSRSSSNAERNVK